MHSVKWNFSRPINFRECHNNYISASIYNKFTYENNQKNVNFAEFIALYEIPKKAQKGGEFL